MQSETEELLEVIEYMARQHTHTALVDRDYNGQVKGTRVTDSGALSSNQSVLELLAKHGRFRIVAQAGRMVVGYWPENDPTNVKAETPL
jgi:2',3'-cyclic-nucleotide 2'-phosphodiesterase (5'-nucleotidase family)